MILIGDSLEILRKQPANHFHAVVTDPPAGISFMGKDWDSDKGGRDEWIEWLTSVMREVHRVLRPGAHAFVWALPRTSHWTGTALENAGFQVRDICTHIFGSGFPKSLDVSKAIDKAAGVEIPQGDGRFITIDEGGKSNGGSIRRSDHPGYRARTPTNPAAKKWSGWGTALKPAAEFYFLARKPLSEKTVAKNVLKWGTGGLNIDGCRVGTEAARPLIVNAGKAAPNGKAFSGKFGSVSDGTTNLGRFPANLVLSCSPYCTDQHDIECPVLMLDEQSGVLHAPGSSGGGKTFGSKKDQLAVPSRTQSFNDSGGASRFFYCAKASRRERNAGLEGMANGHPTIKPIKLMRYLCRLITPPGGIILDPFAGSGTTGVAAKCEGFEFVGIELNPEYAAIAKQRCAT